MAADQPDGREYRDLLLRLIDGIKEDVAALREDIGAIRNHVGDVEKTARSAFVRVEEVERKIAKLEEQANESTLSLAEIKAMSKSAGMVAGAVMGILCSVLTAFLMQLFKIGG